MSEPTPGSKPRLRFPKATPKRVCYIGTAAASVLFLLAIWTGDQRFGQTGIIPMVIGFIAGLCWLGRL